jgi:hypothetical protein
VTAATLAERIATEAHRGRFAPPGQDLELSLEEQRELLDTLKATAEAWPEEERAALHELRLALAVQTSRAAQGIASGRVAALPLSRTVPEQEAAQVCLAARADDEVSQPRCGRARAG